MKSLEILEQQRNDEILRLEIAYSNLSRAYVSGRRDEMIGAVAAALISNPNHVTTLKNGIDKVFTRQYGYKFLRNLNWCFISDEDVKLNVEGCLKAISKTLSQYKFYDHNYTYAQSVLYRPTHTFQQEEVLYQNDQGRQLKVADLLAVSKYAISVAEAIDPDNEAFSKANAAIATFHGIDAMLNNKPEDKPVNKMLHLATSFLSSVVKSSLKDSDAKRGITITAIMVDLAIDFFCKK